MGQDAFGVIFGIVFVSFVVGMLYVIFSSRKKASLELESTQTFAEYVATYPHTRAKNKVACFECDGTNIYLQKIGYHDGKIINYHICKTCGTKLYKSVS